jgi:hypothetical protein
MMMGRYGSKLTARVALLAAIAVCIASCSSSNSNTQAPGTPDFSSMQLLPAPAGSCEIDAVKMCQVVGGSTAPPPTQPSTMSSYGPPNLPDSYEFQIPAGQNIKLMCYYDPQHASVYRADATPDAALTGNSVDYMKQRGFCANK